MSALHRSYGSFAVHHGYNLVTLWKIHLFWKEKKLGFQKNERQSLELCTGISYLARS